MKYSGWKIGSYDRDVAKSLYDKEINPLISVLLSSRGILDYDKACEFTGKSLYAYHDPFLLKDMKKAVSRINKAIENRERITIFGDYDVDGMTATAVVALWLKSKGLIEGDDFDYHLPDRNSGYGLNCEALEKIIADGTTLLITVDCGITAIDEVKYAKSIGLDVVISDHHECRDVLPKANAVINPKQKDCEYPNKFLSGVGVAFKLVCALEGAFDTDEILDKYTQYVALGTIADVMPLGGENRALVRRGLNVLNNKPCVGLRALISVAAKSSGKYGVAGQSVKSEITDNQAVSPINVTSSTIAFLLAPRMNAAGRMNNPRISVDLLLTDSDEQAKSLVNELEELNNRRRSDEQEIYEQAQKMLGGIAANTPIILDSRGWNQGVTGIVASKLSDKYRVPVVVISVDEDGLGRGSCRSIGTYDIYDAIKSCRNILENYGGHNKAAGITVLKSNIEKLRKGITKHFNDSVHGHDSICIDLDFEVIKPELLSIENIVSLESLDPFGSDFPYPRLFMKNVKVADIKSIGKGEHTKIKVEKERDSDKNKGKQMFDCIFFSVTAESLEDNDIIKNAKVDIAFEPQINTFRGESSVQLQIFDIRIAQ